MEQRDWDVFYEIEDRLNRNNVNQNDVRKLLGLIRKLNGNVIDPRSHKQIQDLINSR